jgi:hypothetical protein
VLLWDVRPEIGKGRPLLRECWDDLGRDVRRARAAEATLRRHPALARIVFADRLRSMRVPTAAEIEEQVARLDHSRYAVREAATNWLDRYREDALPILKRTDKGRSAEANARIERLLAPPGPERSADVLRALRAVAVLEAIGGAESDHLLRRLAAGGGLPAVRARDALARRPFAK